MLRQFFLIASICFSSLFSYSQLRWPAVTNTSRPWTRWWWEGNAVNKTDLTWNLEQYRQAGLGGVELTPIYGVYGYEKQFIDFLSKKWMDMFGHSLREAKRLGLGVDLANGTGWPFGGPWVSDDDASKTIYHKTYELNGGERLRETIGYTREAMVRTANNKPAAADTILQPVAKNKNLQALALDQIHYPGELPLTALMAYSDQGEVVDIKGKVVSNGQLDWIAPPGKWTLYAIFQGLHGKMVERAAPGGEGYAIDHFSAKASANYFKHFDRAFAGHDISYLRSFFNDSYEVDDARGQGNWTPLLFDEFRTRKGYDLREHLPALFGKAQPEKNRRVIYDYRSVIDELLLEHFTITWKKWAASKGKMVRNQSHGSPANTLDLYSVVDIPETEGNDILRFKFATSAANVTGKKLVSSESATWLNEHFLSSWGDVKKAIDLFFLGGVNHIFYHGTEYSPKDAPWPGWLFYAAVHFQPMNPQWKDFHALNTYITRAQSFLQEGRPDNDVLLYYPIIDRYSEPGTALLQHFDGMERNFEKTDFEHVSKYMLENGYGFDFFSDRQLQQFKVVNRKITSGGNTYRTILLPANKLISESSMKKLLELARQGATILFYKSAPGDVPGFGELAARRAKFRSLVDQLKFTFAPDSPAQGSDSSLRRHKLALAKLGAGVFYESHDLEKLLSKSLARKEPAAEQGLQLIRRRNTDGYTYFVSNPRNKVFDGWISLADVAASVALFNPMSGTSGIAKTNVADGDRQVYLQLQPHESIIVRLYTTKKTGNAYPYLVADGEATAITGDWVVHFLDGGPIQPPSFSMKQPGSWTESSVEAKNYSGTAKYTITFPRPRSAAKQWLLDLGKVNETAEVFINGSKVATLIGPVFQCVIKGSDLKASNRLEIVVANLMANRIIYMDKNSLPWKIFYNTNMPARRRENAMNGIFNASGWAPLPSGLGGPVTLTPLK